MAPTRPFTPRSLAALEEKPAVAARDIVAEAGEPIDDVEFAFFVILLAVAGNEITRNAMTHGMNAIFDNPDQRKLVTKERPATAVDEIVFDRPFEFDVLRNPNPHLSFGGNGAHFCIGANLACMEIKLIMNELANQIPDIAKIAEQQRLRSGWINGVKDLQVSYRG